MSVCKLSKIDVFIFSPENGSSYVHVPIDNQFLQCEIFPKVLGYFQNILLSEIMTRKLDPDLKIVGNFIVTFKDLALDK